MEDNKPTIIDTIPEYRLSHTKDAKFTLCDGVRGTDFRKDLCGYRMKDYLSGDDIFIITLNNKKFVHGYTFSEVIDRLERLSEPNDLSESDELLAFYKCGDQICHVVGSGSCVRMSGDFNIRLSANGHTFSRYRSQLTIPSIPDIINHLRTLI